MSINGRRNREEVSVRRGGVSVSGQRSRYEILHELTAPPLLGQGFIFTADVVSDIEIVNVGVVQSHNLSVESVETAGETNSVSFVVVNLEWMWSGGVQSDSIMVKAKLDDSTDQLQLAYDTDPTLSSPAFASGPEALAFDNNVVTYELSSLTANTDYYYALEIAGVRQEIGHFRTAPSGAGNFTVIASGDAQSGSNHAVFSTIEAHDPLFFFHLGDMHYDNVAVNDLSLFRAAYDTVHSQSNQASLYKNVAIEHIFDDHDYGANDSDGSSAGRSASLITWRENVPHNALALSNVTDPIYRAFTIGRVRFIVLDTRSMRGTESGSMIGAAQKQWLKDELIGPEPFKVVSVGVPWIATSDADTWSDYASERTEINDYIEANGLVDNVVFVAADMHSIAYDDGTNNTYATSGNRGCHVFHQAPLDRGGSLKGGPWSGGSWVADFDQYAIWEFVDNGVEITFTWRAMRGSTELTNYVLVVGPKALTVDDVSTTSELSDVSVAAISGSDISSGPITTTGEVESVAIVQYGQEQLLVIATEAQGDDAEEFVNASNNDAVRYPAGFGYSDSSDLELNYDPGHATHQWIGLRFDNATIPQGAVITQSFMTFSGEPSPGTTGAFTLPIYGEDVDDASPFVTDADATPSFQITTRTRTTASVNWTINTTWTEAGTEATPDISNIVQEIVDRPGWASGNAIVMILEPDTSTTDYRRAECFDGVTALRPRLRVYYKVPM